MKHESTRTVLRLITLAVLVGVAGLALLARVGSAAVVSGKQEVRWFAGPYQGNPDEPGIDRPQTLHPEGAGSAAPRESTIRIVPVMILGWGVIQVRLDYLDLLKPCRPSPERVE